MEKIRLVSIDLSMWKLHKRLDDDSDIIPWNKADMWK